MPGRTELIGVYKLPVTNELSAAQAEMLYGDAPSSAQCARARRQLESTVLVEVLISDADADFSVADFTQEHPQLPRTN
jgi:hypothetical protein